MSKKLTLQEKEIAYAKVLQRAKEQKQRVLERVRLSNGAVKNGFPADPWVIEYREKNNKIKAKWKARQPKSVYVPKANSGSFKKGRIGKKLSPEEKAISKEKEKIRVRKWYEDNRERYNKTVRDRKKENPSYHIACNLRKRLSTLLSLHKAKKSKQTLTLLGCSMEDFMKHLKDRFYGGMTFDNYGEWHIDHIIPCNKFDLTDPDQQAICFHYSNLQPLWAIDNRIKSDRMPGAEKGLS